MITKPGMLVDAIEREQRIIEGRFPTIRNKALSKLRVFMTTLNLQEKENSDSLIREKAKDILIDALEEYMEGGQMVKDFETGNPEFDKFSDEMSDYFNKNITVTSKETLRLISEYFHLEPLWEAAFGGEKKVRLDEVEKKQIENWAKMIAGGE